LRAEHFVNVAQGYGAFLEHVMGQYVTTCVILVHGAYFFQIEFTTSHVVDKVEGCSQCLVLLLRCFVLTLRILVRNEIVGFVGFPPSLLPVDVWGNELH
jgi:hypothetical protein